MDRMVGSLRHRGPDDLGTYVDHEAQVAIGHTRLSIVELSEAGHQPMCSPDGKVWITFNGEIYNHLDIRQDLPPDYAFRGTSDTETLLCAYLAWGKGCLHRLNGMFAFAIWDSRIRELWLVRDRLGIKPLYYGLQDGELHFASEVRTILADPQWRRDLDFEAIDAFLRLRYVPHPHTLIKGISSLTPGCTLSWKAGRIELTRYWSPDWDATRSSLPAEAEERFVGLLNDSVRLNLMSDVPLGVFLSGGLDSTLITAIAHEWQPQLQTFSVAFEGDDEDARGAAATSRLLGCRHRIIPFRGEDLDRLPEIAAAIDMPIGDAIILPTFCLNKAAREDVKAVITGEGADEILMGYAHQSQLLQLARIAGVLSLPGVGAAFQLASRVLPLSFWDRFFGYGSSLGAAGVDRLRLLVREIARASRRYLNYTSVFTQSDREALYKGPLAPFAAGPVPAGFNLEPLDNDRGCLRRALMRTEIETWLPDNILTKQDNLGMANGLEGRVPYLDHRLVEEVVSWDEATFAAVARGKGVLRRELSRRWPALPRRKKQAFRLDFDQAFRPRLIHLIEDLVLAPGSATGEFVRLGRVRDLLGELDQSAFLRGKQLGCLLVLETWLRKNFVANSGRPGPLTCSSAGAGSTPASNRARQLGNSVGP